MNACRALWSGAVLLALALGGRATAQTLKADYELQNTYDSSAGTIGPLTEVGSDTQSFEETDVNGTTRYVLAINTSDDLSPSVDTSGVQAQTAGYGISDSNYSVIEEAEFTPTVTGALATKIFDFKNLSSDAGLYINATTGLLDFYDGADTLLASGGTPSLTGSFIQVALTRNGTTGLTSVYEDGTLAFSFTDTDDLAVLGDATNTGNAYLTTFKDDGQGIGGPVVDESSEGDLAFLQIYNGVLSASQIEDFYLGEVPEPATWGLLACGGVVLLAIRRLTRQSIS